MIPVSDSAPRRRTPWVNYAIIFLTVLVFLFELSLGRGLDVFVRSFGVTPALITAALTGDPRVPRGVLWTLVTALFLHAGLLHLASNMLFLWIFGDNVEDRLGHLRYLLFYVLCGIGASLAQVLFDPGSRVPLIGASGAIAGVLGAYVYLYPRAWVTVLVPIFFFVWPVNVPVVLMLGMWFVTQLANGVAAITHASQATGGIGWWAHIGGFVLGIGLALLVPKPVAVRPAPHAGQQAATCPRWLSGPVAVVGDMLDLLIGARIILLLIGQPEGGLLGFATRLVFDLTWPLVGPFAGLLPVLWVGGSLLELYSILALLVYHLLIAALLWLLAAICGPGVPTQNRRRG